MIKNILLFAVLFSIATISKAQNNPTIDSYEVVDTTCYDWNLKHFLNVTVKDLDADSTYLVSPGFDLGYIDNGSLTVESPPFVPGDTLRTFKIFGYSSNFAPNGLNTDNLLFTMVGDTVNDPGNTFDGVGSIPLYGSIDATLDLTGVEFCSTDNPVDLTPYATPAGGTFSWGVSETIVTDGLFDIQSYMSEANDGIQYTYENSAGCVGNANLVTPTIYPSPAATMNIVNSTCGNADGSATVNISVGQGGPFDVYWTNGFSEVGVGSTSTASNLSSGSYYANIYDVNTGCHTQLTAQVVDADITITPTLNDPSCIGSTDGSIDLAISGGGNVDEVFWSNGQFGTSISNLGAGEYTVSIVTDNNCKANKTYHLTDTLNKIEVNADNIGYVDCGSTTPFQFSDIEITTTGGSGNYTWNWNSGQTTEDIYGVDVGHYVCNITDNTTGCSYSWSTDMNDWYGPYINIEEIVDPNCGQNNGMIDVDLYPATSGAPISSIQWSNGSTTEDLTGVDAGTYTIIIEDTTGCKGMESFELVHKRPYQPSICLLTVDTSFTYNQIVWEKDPTQNIQGFNVYRETQTQGQFELVAQRPYNLESFFMDNAASPQDRSWRYYITSYDACGNESLPSFIHKTIHTASSTTNGVDYTVSWDDYEGISYSGVNVFRHDNINGWNLIASGQTGNSYVDTPTETAGLDYIVSFVLTTPCTSTKATDYNSSRSNTTSSIFDPGNSTTSISTEKSNQILAYPNPASENITLFIEQWDQFESIQLMDVQGNIVMRKTINDQYTNISVSDFSAGIYIISLTNGKEVYREKIIVE